jgi:probable phosphoglycerate mutase
VTRARRLKVVVEADGGSRGNPGPAGYGAVVREAATGEVLVERAEALGVTTNNVAEYRSLVAGLQAAADLGAVDVEVRMDSKLVVEQMSGRWQIRHPALRPLAAQVAALVRRFDSVRFTWVPRERNRHADALANAAMDGTFVPEQPLTAADAPTRVGMGSSAGWAPPTTAATRLVLIRHGETDLTAQRRYCGRSDPPLSQRGRSQAAAVANRVAAMVSSAGVPPAVIVTSPLSRASATAAEIAGALGGAAVISEPALIECDYGDWDGHTFAEVRRRWPDEFQAWLASTAVAPPGGESFEAVTQRVRPVVSRLLAEHAGMLVPVISHVAPIKLILRDALAATDALLHRLFLDPAGISIVDSTADGTVLVRTVNDTAHLAGR